MTPISFSNVKWCFSARRIAPSHAAGLDTDFAATRPGDMILGRVLAIGNHRRIQLTSGRPSTLYPGDLVALPCAARYAPDQFEGHAEIDPDGCDMLAGGGCLGRMVHRNHQIKPPTRILTLGRIIGRGGRVLNTGDFALPARDGPNGIPAICVIGTAMNSGKTTAAVALSHGLTRGGWRVAALKGTGTGSFGDFNDYTDAGAAYVADFTDAGMATTFLEPIAQVKAGLRRLLGEAALRGADIAVMELADGIFQRETAALLADPAIRAAFGGFIFACGDAIAAAGGVSHLAGLGITPVTLTGKLSCSPMAMQEAREATGIRSMTRAQLLDPAEANRLAMLAGAGVSAEAA